MGKSLRLTQVERKEISDSKMLEAAIDLIVEKGGDMPSVEVAMLTSAIRTASPPDGRYLMFISDNICPYSSKIVAERFSEF